MRHTGFMRTLFTTILAVGVLACATAGAGSNAGSKKTTAAPKAGAEAGATKAFPVEVVSKDGAVTAHFDGETPPEDLKVPLVFGTSRLTFSLEGDKTAYEFKPAGTLEFSDWSFDVFSPDGKWVLLLQDRFGPFHLVSTKNLKAYLQGKAPPDKVLGAEVAPNEAALVHHDAKWVSAKEIEYKVGGETQETKKAVVP